jgi:hypothetical protein
MDTKCFSNPCDMKKLPIFGVHHKPNIRGGEKPSTSSFFINVLAEGRCKKGWGRADNTSTPFHNLFPS